MAGENKHYVAWIHDLPCSARNLGDNCDGPIEAHHAGSRGMSQRAHDNTCIALCRRHHRAWHDFGAPFDKPKAERKDMVADMIAKTQELASRLGMLEDE